MDHEPMEIVQHTESQHPKALLAITFASLLLVAVKGSALLQYWQQTHHILLEFGSLPSTSSFLPEQQYWRALGNKWDGFIAQSESRMLLAGQLLLVGEEALPAPELPVVAAPVCPTPEPISQACPAAKSIVHTVPKVVKPLVVAEAITPITPPADVAQASLEPLPEATPEAIAAAQAPIPLNANDRILLVGDSLMQGLAPHLITSLKRKYQVESMDLSKHSTGLTYPAFFDWPATVED